MTTNNQQVEETVHIDQPNMNENTKNVQVDDMTFADIFFSLPPKYRNKQYLNDLFTTQLTIKDEQHARELELARIEAKIEELKYHSLFYSGRNYSDKTDWKHEVELIESMNDNRIAELNRFKELLK